MSAFTPEQWHEISPYLDHALLLSDQERAKWLSDFRVQRSDLANLLEQLLDEHRVLSQEHFLEHQPEQPLNGISLPGETVGAYRLISRIGEGGMGNVWLAERADGRFERQVAIKFLNFAVASQGMAERFKREGRILGQLAHPHIAELIDAGVTRNGEPYLVLEYVNGKQIDEYCDERTLDVDARINLFLDVLAAVAHAHANLIIHRDLKPSNVLVTRDGDVKLLDFGIAKLLPDDTNAAVPTLLTLEAGSAMTPLFAAPEQLTGGPVTTATDVYAIGALLFLLATGQHPAGPGPHSPAELIKAITEIEPSLVSQTVRSAGNFASAAKRSATPEKLSRWLRGDLDTVIAKALKKNPAERYASVTALADDLRRFLGHEPISARRDSLLYRGTKFVRRNRAVAALASLALLAVLTGAAATVIQARTARRQRDMALRQRDRADRVAQFMTDIFKVSDPGERVGATVTAREVLDKAALEIDAGLAKDPELQAQMLEVMGRAYSNLGLFTRANSILANCVKIGTRVLGPEDPFVLNATRELAWTFFQQGQLTDADALQRKVLETQTRVLGPEHRSTLTTMGNLAVTLCEEQKCREGEILQRQSLALEKRIQGSEAFDTLAAADNLSIMLTHNGKLEEAEKLERETLEIQLRVFGRQNLGTIYSMLNLANILRDLQRYQESEALFRDVLALEAQALGPDQTETAETRHDLACLLVQRSRNAEALSLLRQAIDHGLEPRVDLQIESDPCFQRLRGDPRFAALVAHAKVRAAAQATN
jgi:serine/threonine protein kinase